MGPKKRVTSQGDRLERAAKRRQIGELPSLLVTPATLKRYDKALFLLFIFWGAVEIATPTDHWEADDAASEFVCYLWNEGEPIQIANDALSGLQHYIHYLKRVKALSGAWRHAKAWAKHELPARAAPLTPCAVCGMIGVALELGMFDIAALLVIGLMGLLRTGELFSLTKKQIDVVRDTIMITLSETKTSIRKGADEMVTFNGRWAANLIRKATSGLLPGDRVLQRSVANARKVFVEIIRFFGLEDWGFAWYSLRRGGASWLFKLLGTLDPILLLGRWEHTKTARVYVQDALAASIHVKMSDETTKLMRTMTMRGKRVVGMEK